MGLFSKKKEETKSCCCGGNCTPETMAQAEAAKAAVGVKVLGTGCAKCNALENAVRAALTELGMDTTIDHVTDFTQIAAYGVMTTPALVVDGKVVSYGKVLKKEEAKETVVHSREKHTEKEGKGEKEKHQGSWKSLSSAAKSCSRATAAL